MRTWLRFDKRKNRDGWEEGGGKKGDKTGKFLKKKDVCLIH